MGSTPRPHKFSVPMFSRSTDVSMLGQCAGRWVLTLFYEDKQAEASFFELGSNLHYAIEDAITNDLDLFTAVKLFTTKTEWWLETLEGKRVIETTKRGVDTIIEDGRRMLTNWFKFVHPDSDKRLPIYDDYIWPPQVEVPFMRTARSAGTKYPVWGAIDAVFEPKVFDSPKAFVDWKSGTSKQDNSNQLDFYTFGTRWTDTISWFHHLDRVRANAIIQMADPYPGDPSVRQRILAAEGIKDGIMEDGIVEFNPDWYCNYCPVQEFCPREGWPDKEANMANLERMLQYRKPLLEPRKEVT